MQRLEVSGAVRPIYASLGFKGLTRICNEMHSQKIYNKKKYRFSFKFLSFSLLVIIYLLTYLLTFYSLNPSTWGHSPKDIEHVKNSYNIYKRQNIYSA